MSLQGKTLFITGGSRGIGLAIAVGAARERANIVIAAKTVAPNPKLPGTIYTAAEAVKSAGGHALPVICDLRDESQLRSAVQRAVDAFGGIDILVNNASAISLSKTAETELKRYDLMSQVNARGSFMAGKYCVPHLKRSAAAGREPHILTISPPLDLSAKWFAPHVAYSVAKYGMSLCTLGWAEEFRDMGIAANSLWPHTTIATAAVQMLGGEMMMKRSRKPEIMADAAVVMLNKRSRSFTGSFCIDDVVLREEGGITDFAKYAYAPGTVSTELLVDFFVPDNAPQPF